MGHCIGGGKNNNHMNETVEDFIKKSIKIFVLIIMLILMVWAFIEFAVIHCYSLYQIDLKQLIDKCNKEAPELMFFCAITLLLSLLVFPFVVFVTADKAGDWRKITEETLRKLNGKVNTERLSLFINKYGSKEKLTEKLNRSGFNPEEIELILSTSEKTVEKDMHAGLLMNVPPWMKHLQKLLKLYFIIITLYFLCNAYTEGFHNLRIHGSDAAGNPVLLIAGQKITELQQQKIISYLVIIISSYTLYALFYVIMVLCPCIKEERDELMELKKFM
ncbi:MAG: hypothetical protein ABRQ39_15945 [Candidatus Eremiobacterota bacterium]